MKNRQYLAVITLLSVAACNYTVGECWPVGQGEGNATVGSGPIISGGTSGDWDTPPSPSAQPCNAPESEKEEIPKAPADICPPAPADVVSTWPTANQDAVAYCSAPCADRCAHAPHGFSPSVFVFTTTVADDGKDPAGGWQVGSATLHFSRWTTTVIPQTWTCPVTVGMPVRAEAYGVISTKQAATITAQVATIASFQVMNTEPDLPPGIYCKRLATQMGAEFKVSFKSLGAKVMP